MSQIRPVAMEFEAAHPDGLRRGFLADLLVVSPLTSAATVGDGTALWQGQGRHVRYGR
ncbi:hypothetical protein [Streptomyces microflavus]|uniref:hypothetical protein n=1 Tax=Streptomyces microflavus TaxID=1919 RepID=UPI0033D8F3E6